jgi:hypothetical protein
MPCENIKPDIIEDFIDKEGISRPICIFVNKSITTKGTIAFLFGGYKYERTNKIIAGTKGWSSKDKPLNTNECVTIKELTDLGWRILVFNNMQFATPDNTPLNEMWIEDYVEWIDENFGSDEKRFMVGFSSGAYIVGLHLKHLADGQGRGKIPAYGMFSFSVEVGDSNKKTDFSEIDFKRPTLFLSGSSKLDNAANKPFVDGFKNTRTIYINFGCRSEIRHGWEALNSVHSIFSAEGKEGKKAITDIMDNWFDKYPNFPKSPLGNELYTSQDEGITNPDGCN